MNNNIESKLPNNIIYLSENAYDDIGNYITENIIGYLNLHLADSNLNN